MGGVDGTLVLPQRDGEPLRFVDFHRYSVDGGFAEFASARANAIYDIVYVSIRIRSRVARIGRVILRIEFW